VLLAASMNRQKFSPRPIWYIGVAFVVVGGLLATYHADSKFSNEFVVARMIFVLLIWLWGIRNLVRTDHQMRIVMGAYVLGCAISSFVAMLQSYAHVLTSLGSQLFGRASGLARHPDDTGSFEALGITLAFALALHPEVKRRWIAGIGALTIAMGLIISGSVSGMLCGIAGCFVVLLIRGIRLKTVVTIIAVVAVAYVGSIAIQAASGKGLNPIARFESATSSSGGNNSIGPREGTWKGAWEGIESSPILGHGLDVESSLTYLDHNNNTWYPTHNFILMEWFQGGALFLIGFLICIIEALRRTWRDGKPDPTRAALFAGAISVLLIASQAPTMYDRYFWFPFVLAMTYPLAGPVLRPKDKDMAPALAATTVPADGQDGHPTDALSGPLDTPTA
jgi:O-antigen ligase